LFLSAVIYFIYFMSVHYRVLCTDGTHYRVSRTDRTHYRVSRTDRMHRQMHIYRYVQSHIVVLHYSVSQAIPYTVCTFTYLTLSANCTRSLCYVNRHSVTVFKFLRPKDSLVNVKCNSEWFCCCTFLYVYLYTDCVVVIRR